MQLDKLLTTFTPIKAPKEPRIRVDEEFGMSTYFTPVEFQELIDELQLMLNKLNN